MLLKKRVNSKLMFLYVFVEGSTLYAVDRYYMGQ